MNFYIGESVLTRHDMRIRQPYRGLAGLITKERNRYGTIRLDKHPADSETNEVIYPDCAVMADIDASETV